MASCPKCGAYISPLNWKPNCHACGVYIPYYDMEKRLEADAEKAEREWSKIDALLERFKKHPKQAD